MPVLSPGDNVSVINYAHAGKVKDLKQSCYRGCAISRTRAFWLSYHLALSLRGAFKSFRYLSLLNSPKITAITLIKTPWIEEGKAPWQLELIDPVLLHLAIIQMQNQLI